MFRVPPSVRPCPCVVYHGDIDIPGSHQGLFPHGKRNEQPFALSQEILYTELPDLCEPTLSLPWGENRRSM